MSRTPVILDVDTGIDDALALLLAARHPALDLRAVTCVAGNVPLDQVVRNTLGVLEAAGADQVPVARGATRPLIAPARDASHVHGADGLGDVGLPPPRRAPSELPAIELLRREILASPQKPTLVALAPLTNIALLLRVYPELAPRLERIVFMGGSAGAGNITATAEFNTWADPEALAIVLEAGVKLTMYGLDVFYSVPVRLDTAATLAASADPGARLAGRLLRHYAGIGVNKGRVPEPEAATLGDAGAVCAVIDPAGLLTAALPVRVCLEGIARGQTIVDRRRPSPDTAEPPGWGGTLVDVALGVDGARFSRLFCDTIQRNPARAAEPAS